jgi:signal transduction histidine kinase
MGMRERVESLGGEFQIRSETGKGTMITARLPLQPEGGARNE